MPRSQRSPLLLAGLLAGVGVTHFAAPRSFDATIPKFLPGSPRTWTYASGVAEFALAAGLMAPRTRKAAAIARLPLQVPLVLWARNVARNTESQA